MHSSSIVAFAFFAGVVIACLGCGTFEALFDGRGSLHDPDIHRAVIASSNPGQRMLEALGLEGKPVNRIAIYMEPDEFVRVDASFSVMESQFDKLIEEMRSFELREIQPPGGVEIPQT